MGFRYACCGTHRPATTSAERPSEGTAMHTQSRHDPPVASQNTPSGLSLSGMSSTAEGTAADEFIRRNRLVMGPGASDWTRDQSLAWFGMITAQQALFRGFGQAVEREHGLSPTALSLLGRLTDEPEHLLRISELSDAVGLSLSRTSRVVDGLEARGLVARVACPSDARATNAHLTKAGLALVRQAQATSEAWVQEHFFSRLDAGEVEALANLLGRFAAPGPSSVCGEAAESGGAHACEASATDCDAAADPCG